MYKEIGPRMVPPIYTVYSPPLCVSNFKTSLLRIVLNISNIDSPPEIESIGVLGTTTIRNGVVSDTEGRIVYRPIVDSINVDTFSYSVVSCSTHGTYRTNSLMAEPSIVYIQSADFSSPISRNMKVNGTENTFMLIIFDVTDKSNMGTVTVLIETLPTRGTLYLQNNDGSVGSPLIAEKTVETSVYYLPNSNDCAILFDSFTYSASNGNSKSNQSLVSISIYCRPGDHIQSVGYKAIVGLLTSILIITCILLALWVYKNRRHKFMKSNNPVMLYFILSGYIISYFCLYFYEIEMTQFLCTFRLWLMAIGYMIINGCHYLRVYALWRTFCHKFFKRTNISARNLILIFLAYCAGQIFLLILFTIASPPTIKTQVLPSAPEKTNVVCNYSIPFVWSILIYELVLQWFTCFFCFILNKVDLKVVGSVSVYALLVLSVASLPVFFLMDPFSLEASWIFPLTNGGALTVPLLLMFVPKMIALHNVRDDAKLFQIGALSLNIKDYDHSQQGNDYKLENMPTTKDNKPQTKGLPPEQSTQQLTEELHQALQTISVLQNKLLKKKNQIRELQQKLKENE
eukprot:TRINITY_DN12771_c0_g1_i1.p1 TRINITY_DN12771_c0_g1~~TRINITY_DN12771_c0_g1_i1.p1  ORF type:complete len:571 (-),score=87.60 TRINITY_DN12771_c0_g1_i1:63-1775(-)